MTNLKTAMTCQWCGRKQQANKGVIAHHGYTKEFGYFSGSCRGSRKLPFEANREVKAELISALENLRADWIEARNEIANEIKGISREVRKFGSARNQPIEFIIITRENFEELFADINRRNRIFYAGENSFDTIKYRDIDGRNRRIEMISKDIEQQKKLYNEWKQTHKFNGEWIEV